MKKISFLIVVAIALSLVFFTAAGSAEKKQDKAFTWTMALQNVKTEDMLPFTAPVKSATGDRFRLEIDPAEDCYCYVIAEFTSGEDVAVLQAGPLQGGTTWLSPVLELSPPSGSESIFVVASRDEQAALAQNVIAFVNNSGPTQRRALMNEVFRLRSEVSQFKEAPEKPVLMGGAARGGTGKNEGMEFSGMDTYVKAISLEH